MPRRPVVENQQPSPDQHRTNDRGNDIADTFSEQIATTFGEVIIPGQFGTHFQHCDADLYVNQRKWISGDEPPSTDFAYEQHLHQYLFPPAVDYPLLIIAGREGVGKSTLLRFYFDCYLPNHEQLSGISLTQTDRELFQQTLPKLVILYVNLRRAATLEVADARMYQVLRQQINRAFPGVSTENYYAMWARVAHWHEPHHADGEERVGDRDLYRNGHINEFVKQDSVFVQEALWYLGRRRDETGQRSHYLCLILDDLDQQHRDTQVHVIGRILGWLGSQTNSVVETYDHDENSIDLWRVVVPLRPETLHSLTNPLQPIERKRVIELGEVHEEILLERRTGKLEGQIKTSGKQVECDHFIEDRQTLVFLPMSSRVAAARMKRMLTFDRASDSSQKPPLEVRAITQDFVRNFCDGSIRRFLRLRKRVSSSIVLDQAIDRIQDHFIPHYSFMDSMLTGDRDHFHADDPDNDLLNLYSTTRQPASAHSLLVGPHILYLLMQGNHTRVQLTNLLVAVGYRRVEVEQCLRSMQNKQLIQYIRTQPSAESPILQEDNILQAYWFLVTQPAYIDNIALVTPVENHIRQRMSHTVSYMRSQFRARVHTGLAFLQQLRDDEATVSTWNANSDRYGMTPQGFREHFNALNFPSIYRTAALNYRRSIRRVQDLSSTLMNDTEWNRLLAADILKVSEEDNLLSLRAILPEHFDGTQEPV